MRTSILLLAIALCAFIAGRAAAQSLEACSGTDETGASEAFAAGNALMQRATTEARARHRDRARTLAEQALAQFDRQCTLGDDGALAERGGALILMGEMMRSAQTYDAYLQAHPLDSLDARTRRRVEPNLQPGALTITLSGRSDAHVFVDGLDFGPVARSMPMRLPLGEHDAEAREGGTVVASHHIALSAESPSDTWAVEGHAVEETVAGDAPREPTTTEVVEPHPIEAPAPTRTDYTAWQVLTGVLALGFAGAGIGLHLASASQGDAYAATCAIGPATGCDAVLAERDGMFGGAIASDVLAGLALVGFAITLALDFGQPSREPAQAAIGCSAGPLGAQCRARF